MNNNVEVRQYNAKNTIHKQEVLDVEVDENGHVVAVWYNCLMLPFRQARASKQRATEMIAAYKGSAPSLLGVTFKREKRNAL